ncbi:MAG: M36 family metallopeptidase [Tumebacillaceae bacterium]
MASRKTLVGAVATAIMLTMTVPSAMAATTPVAAPAVAKVDMKSAADQFLKSNAGQYNLKSDLSDLSYIGTTVTDAATYVRYQQMVNGSELFYHQVNVTLDKSGNAVLVVSDYVPNLTVEKVSTKISENEAEKKAKEKLNTKQSFAMDSRQFGYTVVDGAAVPVYKVTTHKAEDQQTYESMVHAGNGKIMKERELDQKATGTGQVFLPNPVASQGSKTGLTDGSNANSTALNNQLKTVTLQGLDGTGYLKGTYASITSKAKTFSSTFTYNFNRSQASFEDVMVYYHIDTMQRYIQSLGFTNINNRAIVANVDSSTQDNSWYTPSTKQLTFGTGGVDDAEDAGIIVHEYGHSIQDNQVPGFGATAEGGAMGEGFGDYLGATYEDSLDGGTFKACIGEWDATSYTSTNPPCLRRLDTNKVYPAAWYGEVHEDGEIWSQGEYDMAQALGRDIATKIILQSHFSLTSSSGFAAGVAAIKSADQLLYGGSHLATINSVWAARGL